MLLNSKSAYNSKQFQSILVISTDKESEILIHLFIQLHLHNTGNWY